MKKYIVLLLLLTNHTHGENLIRMLLDSVKTPSVDLSKTHSNLSRVNKGSFFYYKLKRDEPQPALVVKNEQAHEQFHETFDAEAAKQALAELDNNPVTEEIGEEKQSDDRQIVYGPDSPLRDDAVIEAWERANRAQQALDDHREYMEQVRNSRLAVSTAKKVDTQVNQNDSTP